MDPEDELLTEAVKETESEILNEAFSDDPPKEETPQAEPEKKDDSRDPDTGRFVAKDKAEEKPEEPAAETPKEEADDHGQIPSWRLREVADARRAAEAKAEAEGKRNAELTARLEMLERQIQQQRQPKEEPKAEEIDPLIDPQGFVKRMEDRFDAKRREDQLNFNMALAHNKYGEKFEAAYTAFQQAAQSGDRATFQSVMNSSNPGEAMVRWHVNQQALKEIGSDIGSYKQRLLDEAMKDPAFQAKVIELARSGANANGQQRPNNVTQLPPSLSRATGSKQSASIEDDTDNSDAAVFNYAFR